MSIYGNGTPRFKLLHKNSQNFETDITTIDLSTPTKRPYDWLEEFINIFNYKGKLIYQEKRFRFWTEIHTSKIEPDEMQNIISIANWNGTILYYPDKDVTYFNIPVYIENFKPLKIDDKVHHDGAILELQGVSRLPRVPDPDSFFIAAPKTVIV